MITFWTRLFARMASLDHDDLDASLSKINGKGEANWTSPDH